MTDVVDVDNDFGEIEGPHEDPQDHAMREVAFAWSQGEEVSAQELSDLSVYLGFEAQDRDYSMPKNPF